MRLKRLDITGFKSFMDRMVFTFDDGITAVVGPNGCGKSNVVDAIRWVMGEQSAKNLRGRGMEDVIFNGSETHAPLSMAEVTLTLTIDEGDVLPETLAGLPEVSVTRRLFRSGESEYQLNRTTTRLLDITELFLGTGVGTRAYSIIEQGRVGQIVSARPEDRRSFIEEAAGITKYKARRRAAERKMEHTQHNLLRVTDIVVELERRLDALERQAKKAEKYKRLKAEMRDIELHHSGHRFLELFAQRSLVTGQLDGVSADERAQSATMHALEADIATRRQALEAETLALETAAAEFYALEAQVQLDAQNLGHWKEDLEATRARVQSATTELAFVVERKQVAEREKLEAEAELQRLGLASREDEVQLEVYEESLRRAVELMGQVTVRLDAERRELVDVVTRVANHESNLANLDGRRAELLGRSERLRAERETLATEQAQLEDARKEVLSRVEQSRQFAIELSQRSGEEESSLSRLRGEFTENEVMVLAVRDELSDKRSRLQSLEEIQRTYEGFDRGVRAVMTKAGDDLRQAGVFGLVSDVVSAPPEFEKAIEAALGEQLQHVIVETPARATEYVEYLKALGDGRSTFLPVSAEQVESLPPLEGSEVRAMALTQVQVKEELLRPLIARLLSGVVLVHDLESAHALAARAPGYTFVTVDGEVLRPGGALTGGIMEGAAVGALQKKREVAELAVQVKQLEERYQDLITRHYELQKQVGQIEGVLKGLEKNKHQEELSLQGHEKDLSQAASSLVKLKERIAGLDAERSQLDASAAAMDFELEASRGEVAHGQTDRRAREERVALLSGELEALTTRNETVRAEATTLKVKVASSSERGSSARQRADTLADQVTELTERAGRLAVTRDEGSVRIAELEVRVAEIAEGRDEREASVVGTRATLDARKQVNTEAASKVREDEAQLKDLRGVVEGLAHEVTELTLKVREQSLEMDTLATLLRERHAVTIDEVIHQYHLHPQLGAEAVERLKELRAQVEKMGEVNVTAIEEHQELAQRFEFLSTQKKDLESSLEKLTDAIKTIDETSRQRFKETFDVVNEKFQQVFPRLFGGGRASLLLTQEPGQTEPGIEILAQPPGKKLQSVNLFSGGEKALTAVALIFGIFLIKPTPFCLLDEVDAPLDEGNVGRYNEMVREMSKTSQFILITHNKRTMEIGDTLYGVTMEEPGVSKLVAVNMKEAAANSDVQVA